MSPAPTPLHQDVIFRLQTILHQAAPSHLKVFSTVNVRASDRDFYIPDIVVVPRARARSVALMFAPSDLLLVVEVVSPSTGMHDRTAKVEAYAAAGIPLYWRVDPEGPILYVYELEGDTYQKPVAHKAGSMITLSAPYPVTFDPAELIDD